MVLSHILGQKMASVITLVRVALMTKMGHSSINVVNGIRRNRIRLKTPELTEDDMLIV